MTKFFNRTIKFSITIFLIVLFFVFSAFWYFSHDLPDYKKLSKYEPSVLSRVYADDGHLIAEYAVEKRLFIPIESIPEKVINAFLSAEDKNFFDHPGVDAKGVTRALIKNISNIISNKRLEGASTITQQVAKNFLLTNEVSLKRKIKEAILAFRIEKAYSKKRILELYLNEIYLGQGTYGVASASLEYFNKSVKQLNYNEAALLAALPKAPSKYNPYKAKDLAKKRRNLVLKNLKDNGYISSKEFKKMSKANILLNKREVYLIKEAESYTEEVRRIINTEYGFKKLYSEGLSISTPLKGEYQIAALKSLRDGIEKYDKRHGWRGAITNVLEDKNWENKIKNIKIDKTLRWEIAQVLDLNLSEGKIKLLGSNEKSKIFLKDLKWTNKKNIEELLKVGDIVFVKKNRENKNYVVKQLPLVNGSIVVMDPFNGKVKALVGGYSFVSSEFNRATQAKRQPGSAFKPIVYASALENGFLPNSLILDAPFVSKQGIGLKKWKPENYGKKFYGPSTLRKGIEKSRNLMTVRIAQRLGFEKISKISRDLGIYENVPELLSVSLGSNETTLLKLTNAYCVFANGGKKVEATLINRIQDRRGKTIFNSDERFCEGCDVVDLKDNQSPQIVDQYNQVISKETAFQITSMLEGAVKRGTGKKLKVLGVPLAGKTGTTNKNFDAWFIGFTSRLVIGVYIGFDEPRSLGKFETGSKAALPIFKNFVESAIYKEEMKQFNVPKNIYFFPVDYDSGKNSSFASTKVIIEAFKEKNLKEINSKNLKFGKKYDRFKRFY